MMSKYSSVIGSGSVTSRMPTNNTMIVARIPTTEKNTLNAFPILIPPYLINLYAL